MREAAIDLTWVRHKKVGGTESCVRNLLYGFAELNPKNMKIVLLLSRDNAYSFEEYRRFECFELYVCAVESGNQKKRIIWQNTKLGKLLRERGISVCLEPIYSKPFFGMKGIHVITTIHDLQALHYPQYFSKAYAAWMRISWKNTIATSATVIAISNYVKNDIIKNFKVDEKKIQVIYDAVNLNAEECGEISELSKYGIDAGRYYYSVSSLLPHKNLKTLVLTIAELKKRNSDALFPLVISGVGGSSKGEIEALAKENGIEKEIILTAFVDNAERNLLYKNCRAFVFPSVFEGFGMPPVEAMALGAPVLTTKCTSLEEVTGGLLNYVNDPLKPQEWADMLESGLKKPGGEEIKALMQKYDCKEIAGQYEEMFLHYLN